MEMSVHSRGISGIEASGKTFKTRLSSCNQLGGGFTPWDGLEKLGVVAHG